MELKCRMKAAATDGSSDSSETDEGESRTCFNCGKVGNLAKDYREETREDSTQDQTRRREEEDATSMTISREMNVPEEWW